MHQRKGRRCTIIRPLGTVRYDGSAGQNVESFNGRVGATRLPKGNRYRMVLVATDSRGRKSAPVALSFSVS